MSIATMSIQAAATQTFMNIARVSAPAMGAMKGFMSIPRTSAHTGATLTCELRITGDLEGVGYRWSLARLARSMGLSGWVQKQGDGQVQAVISGPTEAVQSMIEWARRGTVGARVQSVQVSDAQGSFEGFEQRESAWLEAH